MSLLELVTFGVIVVILFVFFRVTLVIVDYVFLFVGGLLDRSSFYCVLHTTDCFSSGYW